MSVDKMTVMTTDKMTEYKMIVDNKVVSIKSIHKNDHTK